MTNPLDASPAAGPPPPTYEEANADMVPGYAETAANPLGSAAHDTTRSVANGASERPPLSRRPEATPGQLTTLQSFITQHAQQQRGGRSQ